jgi:hypothetical protein
MQNLTVLNLFFKFEYIMLKVKENTILEAINNEAKNFNKLEQQQILAYLKALKITKKKYTPLVSEKVKVTLNELNTIKHVTR